MVADGSCGGPDKAGEFRCNAVIDNETLAQIDLRSEPRFGFGSANNRRTNRAQRNSLLQASDWTSLPDPPLANRDEWISYRAQLRSVDLGSPVWPTVPKVQWT